MVRNSCGPVALAVQWAPVATLCGSEDARAAGFRDVPQRIAARGDISLVLKSADHLLDDVGSQLSVCQLGKLLAHNAAMYRPTLRQMDQQFVLHVCSRTIRFCEDSWKSYCSRLLRGQSVLLQSLLPLTEERKEISARVRDWIMKRPARALKRPTARLKRTPFTLARVRGE